MKGAVPGAVRIRGSSVGAPVPSDDWRGRPCWDGAGGPAGRLARDPLARKMSPDAPRRQVVTERPEPPIAVRCDNTTCRVG